MYKARSLETGRIVAIKGFRADVDAQEDRSQATLVVRELHALLTNNHRNVLRAHRVVASKVPHARALCTVGDG